MKKQNKKRKYIKPSIMLDKVKLESSSLANTLTKEEPPKKIK